MTKLFISYCHEDAGFKNKLVTMLGGAVRRGSIELWQDLCIEPGEEWLTSIKQAINECNMALLLVSADFINSRFINETELPDLLMSCKEKRKQHV